MTSVHTGSPKIKVARIASVPFFFTHLLPTITDLQSKGFEVDLICAEEEFSNHLRSLGFNVISFPIKRDISPFFDLISIWKLASIFKKNKYQIVHSTTPKGGLISAVAAMIAKVPVRMHTFTGQRWATVAGPKRILLKWIDGLIAALSSECHADSPSQIEFLQSQGVFMSKKIICLGAGSLGGVDFNSFSPDRYPDAKLKLSQEMHLDYSATWFLFVGRVTRDKGINELVTAFKQLSNEENVELIMAGSFEDEQNPVSVQTKNLILNHPRIHFLGFQNDPGKLMAASDVLCLPSYREGFGTVVIEAAASGTCAIGTKISGLKDAIEDGLTGILVPPQDPDSLKQAMQRLAQNPDLVEKMGSESYVRAREKFSSEHISQLLVEHYREHLKL